MNLSFQPTCQSVSLWWAMAWRSMLIGLLLLVPVAAALFVIQMPMVFGLPLAYAVSPYVGIAVTILFIVINLLIQWFLLPVIVYAFVLRWLFRRGHFGANAISGTYLGTPVTTLRNAFKFSAFFFLENIKYVWPLAIGGALVGFTADAEGNLPPHVSIIVLCFIPLSIYLYTLVLADLIRRRRFSRLQLIVVPRAASAAAAKLPVAKAVAAPVAAAKPAAKPAPKAVAKPVAKAAAKSAAKPVAKAKQKPKAKAKK